MVKLSDILCNKSLGGNARRLSGAFPTSFRHAADVSLSFYDARLCNVVFLTSAMLEMHVNVSVTVKTFGGISLFDGGKFEKSKGYNYIFVVFYVLESK